MSVDLVPIGESGLYEMAYLCGGANRVAAVALVALCQDGRLKVAYKRQRVFVTRTEPRNAVEAAALDAIPPAGRLLPAVLFAVAASPAVAEIAESLRDKGLGSRGWRRQSRYARQLRKGLLESPGEGWRRVAVLGTSGIADERLRRAFETPVPGVTVARKRIWGREEAPDSRASFWSIVRLTRSLEREAEHHAGRVGYDSGHTPSGGGGWGGDGGGWGGGDGGSW